MKNIYHILLFVLTSISLLTMTGRTQADTLNNIKVDIAYGPGATSYYISSFSLGFTMPMTTGPNYTLIPNNRPVFNDVVLTRVGTPDNRDPLFWLKCASGEEISKVVITLGTMVVTYQSVIFTSFSYSNSGSTLTFTYKTLAIAVGDRIINWDIENNTFVLGSSTPSGATTSVSTTTNTNKVEMFLSPSTTPTHTFYTSLYLGGVAMPLATGTSNTSRSSGRCQFQPITLERKGPFEALVPHLASSCFTGQVIPKVIITTPDGAKTTLENVYIRSTTCNNSGSEMVYSLELGFEIISYTVGTSTKRFSISENRGI